MSNNISPEKHILLNYSRIKSEILKAGYSIGEFCMSIDRSDKWFYSAENNTSMKVTDLCAVCEKLKLPVQYFFDNNIESNALQDFLTEREILHRILDTNKQILEHIKLVSKV